MKITAFGDSLTAGWGVRPGQDYPKLLEDGLAAMGFPGVQVLNRGISGETTSDLHYRVPGVLEERPDIILLGIGTNDILQG
ncbi:MAG: arylesterase, partial [Spirochaetaceae bacterium]